jgi:hypothetical protein
MSHHEQPLNHIQKSSMEAAPQELVQMALLGENGNSRAMKSFVNSGYKYQSSNLNADIISNISNVPK